MYPQRVRRFTLSVKRISSLLAWQFLHQPDANSAAEGNRTGLRRTPAPMVYIGNLGRELSYLRLI